MREVLDEIGFAKHVCSEWIDENYPNLCSPVSPCVTLQWTYRDARIVNLPWALLVRDDLIIIRPGQVAPGACETSDGRRRFDAGETYGVAHSTEPPLKPTARTPLPDMECRLLETPYLENLRTSLDKFLERPMTIYNQQRHLVSDFEFVWTSNQFKNSCNSVYTVGDEIHPVLGCIGVAGA